MKVKNNKAKENLDFFLKDFVPDDQYHEPWEDSGNGSKQLKFYKIELPKEIRVPYPFMVYLLFVEIKKYPVLPPFEKVAWEIPIRFKGRNFVLAHRKFGFAISTYTEQEDDKELAIEAITLIHKAVPFADYFVNDLMKERINQGFITIENEYIQIWGRFHFFLDKVNQELKNKNSGQAGFYYLLSMIDAYFSYIEHILVLLLPFMKHIDLKKINIETFIGMNWKDKFNLVLDTETDRIASKHLNALNEIKEQLRNPASHGNFLKKGHSFYVHMPNLGAIPFTLTKSKTHTKYSFEDHSEIAFQNIVKVFRSFDRFLLDSPRTKFAMKYLENDFSVAFDRKSVTTYRRRLVSEKSTKIFIKEIIQRMDNYMNMDW